MITLKISYTTSEENALLIKNIRQQYSCVVRYAYNRFHEGKKEKEVRELCRHLNNISLLNSWLLQCAILDGKSIQTRNKDKKVVFGGKKNSYLRSKNKLGKEQFKEKRLQNITSQGEKLHKGNRMFSFTELSNNKIIFKLNKKQHIDLEIHSQRKNYKSKLEILEQLSLSTDVTITAKLSEKFIYLTYEEPKPYKIELLKNRYMGIDLNPNYIGISVFEDDKVIHTKAFDFSKITNKITSESNSSDSKRAKYLNNKFKHETLECSKIISQIAKQYKTQFVFIEDLSKINTKDSGLGIKFNRLTRNLWKRTYFELNLTKRLSLLSIKLYKINPAYSSIIGNCQYNYFDPCNAACEIARRGYNVIIIKNKKFYPDFTIKPILKDLWKEHLGTDVKDWKETFKRIKNSKLRYRVPLKDTIFKSLQMKSKQSLVTV